MSCLVSLCVSLWLAALAARTSASSPDEDINVLVLLPENNSYPFSIARVKPAIEYAKQAIKVNGPGQSSQLNFSIKYRNSECGNHALFALIDECQTRPDLVLGPVCEYAAAGVARVASRWNIPMVTAGALAVGFDQKKPEYTHLTRVAPSYMKMAETFASLFVEFNWKNAVLIYDDDKEERNCFFTMEGVYVILLHSDEYNVQHITIDPKEEKLDADEIVKNLHSEVVVICAHAAIVREIMLAAHRRKMTNGSYIFFNIDLFNSTDYGLEGSWKRGDKYDKEARAAYSALNTVTLLRTVKPEFENFTIELKKSVQRPGVRDCKDCDNVNMFMEGFHDALLLYAIALHEAKKNGYSKKDGHEITRHMWNRTFEGIAGQVSIDTNGDREGDFSVMSMTDREAGTYETVMNYFGVNGTFQVTPGFNSGKFLLHEKPIARPPSEHGTTPDMSSCGLGVSAVTGIIVGALLGAALLMAFYFFRKNYRITIERRTNREECNAGKHRQLREDSIRSNFSTA
ncbi:atrial natriuretic peptide receptor 3 isoform X2 [Engraulis encrasicolus]|uniref:atrial natriuretic peptide receptor 3 isoform X2 n=1 Tax=Engraulis encrasicolus TaxID=184585 RepID=UPI002FD2BBD3